MATYYLDIETTGLDERKDKIITIQYQELDRNSGRPLGSLNILKAWEFGDGERGMLERLISDTRICSSYGFDFVTVGTHLEFEHRFLHAKSTLYGLEAIDIGRRPSVDIQSCLVLMNGGEFKGSGLDRMTGKRQSGYSVPAWYEKRMYDEIEGYIKNETEEFLKFYAWLCGRMPGVWREFRDGFLKPPAAQG